MSETAETVLLPRRSMTMTMTREGSRGLWAKRETPSQTGCDWNLAVEAAAHLQAPFRVSVQSRPSSAPSVSVVVAAHDICNAYPYEDLPVFGVHDVWLADNGCI
jgi:hypothetical protein